VKGQPEANTPCGFGFDAVYELRAVALNERLKIARPKQVERALVVGEFDRGNDHFPPPFAIGEVDEISDLKARRRVCVIGILTRGEIGTYNSSGAYL